MGDPIHLEKMGRELKCPICLSLLNSAVSLTCNHVFCNSCIVKSMKSGSTCPVCKVPYRRREVRAAPHMDSLVSIYKSMEAASGFQIFVTQNPPSAKSSDTKEQVEADANCGREDIHIICQDRVQKKKSSTRKRSRNTTKSSQEVSDPISAKPSFPAKKRVQVPQCLPSETPTRTEKLEIGSGENIKDGFKNRSLIPRENPAPFEKGEPVFSPFFWLRDDEGLEKLSQHTIGSQFLDITPPNIPTFSDIKDSDDDSPSKLSQAEEVCGKPNDADLFNSEMFEWTQKACSPELFSSPAMMQDEDAGEIDGNQESKQEVLLLSSNTNEHSVGNEKCSDTEDVMDIADEESPTLSPLRPGSSDCQVASNKSKRKVRTARKKATLKKCVKKDAEQNFEVPSNSEMKSRKIMQKEACDKGNSLECKKTRRREKAVFGTSAAESKPENALPVSLRAEAQNQSDKKMAAELSTSLCKKQCHNENLRKNIGKMCGNASTSHAYCSLRLKKQKLDSTDMNVIEETYKVQNPLEEGKSPPEVDDGLLNDHQEGHISISAKETQCIEKAAAVSVKETQYKRKVRGSLGSKIPDNSEILGTLGQANVVALHTCQTLALNIHCAFCLSSEDSEASGEMVHYCNGRPVAANYNSGSKVIHSHRNCAEWAPNVYFEDDTAINLEAELTRSRRITCCCCGLKGAALGCYEKSCRKSFHVTCAKMIPQCRWDTNNFVMLCPLHASSKLPDEDSGSEERIRKKCIPKRKRPNQCSKVVLKHDVSSCPNWNSSVTADKLVLCCSALTVEEKEIVSEFERLSGVIVLKNWDLSVTHVIASTNENGACRRTLKILMGILEGKWILNIEWVKACMKAMELVQEEKYEILVDIHGIRDGPRLGRLRILNKQPKIFEGFRFYMLGDFVASYKGYIQDLLIAGGGTVLHRKPISGAQGVLSLGSSTLATFIIYSIELPDKCDLSKKEIILNRRRGDAETLASATGARAVSNSWVLNSIAACKLQNFAE
ncbi:protein BREAST CANCER SUSCEPTIBILITY 1 homolog isoform X2 [Hevea brasiliensis]|uniref:protein BREAST CANCER SUSCEPTIBILITY 1 homolog isoform X2 n=1 Tax=Hevea brasiliensis TaxID=3981 RepID=UPI0025D8D6EA|nr:protein BREAST CANCER SUSCEPTIBILITY 1 homolog isoform X2 [Hevea brasiliensis]